jgi:hypothetical protein
MKTTASGNLPEAVGAGQTRDKVAAALGTSGRTLSKVLYVQKAIDADPEGNADLAARMEERGAAVHPLYETARQRVAEHDDAEDGSPRGAAKAARPDPDIDPAARVIRGKGLVLAQEAINCLTRIPPHDADRVAGLKRVAHWIRQTLRGT